MFSINRAQRLVADDFDCGHNQNGPEHDFRSSTGAAATAMPPSTAPTL
jgi:hypothetical protein